MNLLPRNVLSLLCLLGLTDGLLRGVELQTLVDRNPFAPAGQAAGPVQPAEQPTLEFRGMVTDFEGTAYNIFDTSTSKGAWVRVDDPDSPFKVRGYDPSSSTIEVEQNGRPLKLTLKRATIQAGPAMSAMVAGASAPGVASGEARRTGDSGTDARRLEAVAAEVRRRRALRSAAGTAQGQPPAAAKPASPAGP
jgi:hypothetical protein